MWFTIDGVSTTHLNAGGGDGSYWDYETIDEVRVQSLGTDAEFQTRGVQMTGIVKSGGNQFHGGGSWAQNNKNFQSDNINDELEAQGFTIGNALKTPLRRQRRPGRPHHSRTSCGSMARCAGATRKRKS